VAAVDFVVFLKVLFQELESMGLAIGLQLFFPLPCSGSCQVLAEMVDVHISLGVHFINSVPKSNAGAH
jgi:hypothetical protein